MLAPADRRVIVVSGGSRGFGLALVKDFLARGHAVATFSRRLSPAIDELASRDPDGKSFLWRELDASSEELLDAFVKEVESRLGPIHTLVNNAARIEFGPLALAPAGDIHQAVSVNVEAVLQLTRACCRLMIHRRAGCILNVSSASAVRGSRGVAVYAATKAALDGLTRALAHDLGPRGVRVNSIAPGLFESERGEAIDPGHREQILQSTPLRRLGTMEDMLNAVRFLTSPEASFITGQVLVVDGGLTC